MERSKLKYPDGFCFTQEHMEHMETLLKLLARSPGGMTAAEVDRVADSLVRLRNSIVIEGHRQKLKAELRKIAPVPFRGFNLSEFNDT